MKKFIISAVILFSFCLETLTSQSTASSTKDKSTPLFEIVPLNSPIKTSMAIFQVKAPSGFQIDKLKVKLTKAHDHKPKRNKFEEVKVNGDQFSISVSNLAPGFYRLFVIAIDKKSGRELPFKNQFHDYVRFVIDESMEVPMPNPKVNNASIAGVDIDNNGIRDDIQRLINEKYSNEPQKKLAAKQYAAALQRTLLTADNQQENIEETKKRLNTLECWGSFYTIDEMNTMHKESELLKFAISNTKERIVANKKSDFNFHGQSGTISRTPTQYCDFPTE